MIRLWSIAVLFIAGAAGAQVPSGPVMLPANGSCGDWFAARQHQGAYRWENDVSWFQGFIAGHNVYTKPPDNRAIVVEPNDAALWIDTFCRNNPTQHLVHAATAYIEAHGGTNPFPEAKSK